MMKYAMMVMVLMAGVLRVHAADDQNTEKYLKKFNNGGVETGVMLLNRMEAHPAVVSEIYSKAYELLADKDADFGAFVEDEAFQKLCQENGIRHLGGPMVGSITPESAKVWVRTCRPAEVSVQVKVGDQEKVFGPVKSAVESDLVAIIPVSGLSAGSSYPYSVLVDGETIVIPETAVIQTAPDNGKVRIAFGSCYHRSGIGNPAQADLIRSRGANALLLLGDIAVQDRNNHLGNHRSDYLLRDLQNPWRRLVAGVPVYALWDDHDYFNNDQAGIPKNMTAKDTENVCEVFKASWVNPSYGFNDERRGIFMHTQVGPCDIITVDHRYFRNREPEAPFLGKEQMQWLKQALLDCKGSFIILGCGTMWSDYVSNGKDSWGKASPEEREELFSFIEDNHIGGVLLVSGDRHGARGFAIPRPSGFSFYEFEPGSMGGRTGPPARQDSWTTQLFGIANEYAFGEFTMDATLDDPEVTFRLVKDDGTTIYETTLARSQLTPGMTTR